MRTLDLRKYIQHAGGRIDDGEMVTKILAALPKDYSEFVNHFEWSNQF